MWSNVISMNKTLVKELDYVTQRLKTIKNLSYAMEESKDRVFIYLASICEVQEKVESEVCEILKTIFLSFYKLTYFKQKLKEIEINHATCALICSLVHFDYEYESNLVQKMLSEAVDFNVDGLMNFRMNTLTKSWDELAEVCLRLMQNSTGEKDIFDIASFITGTDGKTSQLTLKNGEVFNLTKRKSVEVINLFENDDLDLLSAIIKEHPSEIMIEKKGVTEPMERTLRHIARVIER